jgi:hypothetical protein
MSGGRTHFETLFPHRLALFFQEVSSAGKAPDTVSHQDPYLPERYACVATLDQRAF